MTQTKLYSLTPKEYTKIVMSTRLKKYWWLYLVMLLVGFVFLKDFGTNKFASFMGIFLFIYPFIAFAYLYFWSKSKDHDPIFSKTSMSFDDKFLYFKSGEDETKLASSSIQKVIELKHHLLLYVSKGRFIYIPKRIFYTEEDYNSFLSTIN